MEQLIEHALITKLPKRTSLSIPKNICFGLEIENNGLKQENFNDATRIIQNIDKRFEIQDDFSLNERSRNINKLGLEIATPVFRNNKNDLLLLKKISKTLQYINPKYNLSSLQVNLDDNLTVEQKMDLLKVFAFYETILLRFSRGRDNKLRDCSATYSKYIYYTLLNVLNKDIEECEKLSYFTEHKMYAINFKKNTAKEKIRKPLIEFRSPNGTNDLSLWLNYVNTFYYFLESVSNNKHDMELIEYTLKNPYQLDKEEYNNSFLCFPVNETLAIDFANRIFDNEEDKIYFLQQYIGNDPVYNLNLHK